LYCLVRLTIGILGKCVTWSALTWFQLLWRMWQSFVLLAVLWISWTASQISAYCLICPWATFSSVGKRTVHRHMYSSFFLSWIRHSFLFRLRFSFEALNIFDILQDLAECKPHRNPILQTVRDKYVHWKVMTVDVLVTHGPHPALLVVTSTSHSQIQISPLVIYRSLPTPHIHRYKYLPCFYPALPVVTNTSQSQIQVFFLVLYSLTGSPLVLSSLTSRYQNLTFINTHYSFGAVQPYRTYQHLTNTNISLGAVHPYRPLPTPH